MFLAACGGVAPPSTSPTGAPAACAETPAPAPPEPPAPSSGGDPARPEDEAAIAALLAAAPVVAEHTPRWSPDGRTIAFVSNRDGPNALYLRAVDGDAPARRVVDVPPRFRRPVFSLDGRHLYFTTDASGDEAYVIRRVDLARGVIEAVAIAPQLERDGPWMRPDGGFVFAGRPTNETRVAFYRQGPDLAAPPEEVFASESTSPWAARSDGARVLAIRAPLDDALEVVDLATGHRRALYPPSGATGVRVYDTTFAPTGPLVYVATDAGEEATHLLALDARTGREVARFTEPDAAVGEVHALTCAGGTLAYVVDLGTHHEVRVLDARTLRPRASPVLPLGSEVPGAHHPTRSHGLALAPDGRRLAVEWSTPSSPARVLLVDTRTGAVTPLTREAPPVSPIETEVVRIPSFDGLALPTLVYRAPGGGPRPVIVAIHGGFVFASTARHDPQLTALLSEGWAVVEPNVRGSGGFGRRFASLDDGPRKLEAVRDLRAVAEWIGAQPWADRERLAILGPSAGGYMTLMALGHQPELWRAGVAIVPLADVGVGLAAMEPTLRSFLEIELAPLSEPALVAAVSPSTYANRIRAPLFVYAAANDVRAPVLQVDALVRSVRGRGGSVEYMRAEGVGHSRIDPRAQAELSVRLLRFLRAELGGR